MILFQPISFPREVWLAKTKRLWEPQFWRNYDAGIVAQCAFIPFLGPEPCKKPAEKR
jgi:hypothetical protein